MTTAAGPDSVRDLLHSLESARVFDLEQPRYPGAPALEVHQPGFLYTLHRRHEPGLGEARTSASGIMIMAEHSGTHIDALCHQAENMRLYGGQEAVAPVQGPRGFSVLAAEHIPLLFSRGVLLDVAAARGVELIPPGELIDRQELAETADRHGVDLMPGDVVLVRTGTGALWDNPDEYLEGAGMGVDASRWLARQSPVAVGSDNVAWDSPKVSDPELGSLPGHVLLIVRGGIYIIENLFLEELAREEIREFMLLCVPLKMRGVTASPVRPLAIAPQGDDERSG